MSIITWSANLFDRAKKFALRIVGYINLSRPYTGPVESPDDLDFDRAAIDDFMPEIQELIYERQAVPGTDFYYADGKLYVNGSVGIDMQSVRADKFKFVTNHPRLLAIESELGLPFFTRLWSEISTTRQVFGGAEFQVYLVALLLGLQLRFPELDSRLLCGVLQLWLVDLSGISTIISLVGTQIAEDNLDRTIQKWLTHDILRSFGRNAEPAQPPTFSQLWCN
jgi:hypothetical protein